jgi:predicted acetyltransferase
MNLILRPLNENDEQAFLEGLKQWDDQDMSWYSFIWTHEPEMKFQDMLTTLKNEAAGIHLRPGKVAHTMLYGFVDGHIIGRVSVRHELNDYLRKRGGHIGYAVAKKYRQKGYATEMVRLALDYCKYLGISSILITCADDNTPSWKIIERFGGQLEDRVYDEEDQEIIRRYWVRL